MTQPVANNKSPLRLLGTKARARTTWYQIRNATSADEADVFIYDAIDSWFGISAKTFSDELRAIRKGRINLHINSPGGDVFDGVAIYNALRQHPARVVTYVDGLAASIASVIALAGDEVRIAENAFFMVHNPWAFAIGDSRELRKTADTLDQVATGALVTTYMSRTGRSEDEVRQWMDAETWFSGQEAVDAGLADALDAHIEIAASFDLDAFCHAPEPLIAAARAAAATHTARDDSASPGRRTPPRTIRDFEKLLRDEGFSCAAARRIAEGGFRSAPEPRDEDGEAIATAAQLMRMTHRMRGSYTTLS